MSNSISPFKPGAQINPNDYVSLVHPNPQPASANGQTSSFTHAPVNNNSIQVLHPQPNRLWAQSQK